MAIPRKNLKNGGKVRKMDIRNTRTLVVKSIENLEKYGFVKEGDCYKFYTKNKGKYGYTTYTIYISTPRRYQRKQGYFISISSHAGITLETICKMYVDGVIDFVDKKDPNVIIKRKEEKIKKLESEIERLKREINETN